MLSIENFQRNPNLVLAKKDFSSLRLRNAKNLRIAGQFHLFAIKTQTTVSKDDEDHVKHPLAPQSGSFIPRNAQNLVK